MGLPSILRPRKKNNTEKHGSSLASDPTTQDNSFQTAEVDDATLKRVTRLRKGFALSASCAYLIAWIFLLLVVIGNTYPRPVLKDIYFFKLNLADIIPTSVPNAQLINSIARSIGLHDFYQVGLWNFCEGYIDEYVSLPLFTHPPT
ncbi:hypothetical protein VTK26DRAFT_7071 [Humicola hyalothermophila]